eukprot:11665020-Ditylum_brightwellii.AAC.1
MGTGSKARWCCCGGGGLVDTWGWPTGGMCAMDISSWPSIGEGEEWVAAQLHLELYQPLRWKLRHAVVELSRLGTLEGSTLGLVLYDVTGGWGMGQLGCKWFGWRLE